MSLDPYYSFLAIQEVLRTLRLKMLQLCKHCEQLVKFGKGSAQREAFIVVSDLSVIFARQLRKIPQLASLVYVPEPSLQQALQVSNCISCPLDAFLTWINELIPP